MTYPIYVKKSIFFVKDKIRLFEIRLPTKVLIFLLNIENILKASGTRLTWDKRRGQFLAVDTKYRLAFCRKERSVLYASGVTRRINSLAHTYFQNELPKEFHGTFIDCGANVGELSLFVAQKYNCEILAFEPEPMEYRCLTQNLSGFDTVQAFNKALWEEKKDLFFYSSPETADSSLIPSESDQKGVIIQAITLDSLLTNYLANPSPIILKIEAEGAEPEVIRGSKKLLERAALVLVDGGPERGLLKEKTEPQNDLELFELGFMKMPNNSTRCQVYVRRSKESDS